VSPHKNLERHGTNVERHNLLLNWISELRSLTADSENTMPVMHTQTASLLAIISLFTWLRSPAISGEAAAELKEVQNLSAPELKSVNSVVISSDGNFAYAAAFGANTVSTFQRDPATGQLNPIDILTDPALQSVVFLCLSKDEKYVAACAFGSSALTLFRRDPISGRLEILDSVHEAAESDRGLRSVITACFSPNADFIYTGCLDGMGVYQIKADKLKFVQSTDAAGKLSAVRAVTLSPKGEWIYAAAQTSGTLGVFQRDAESGLVTVAQILSNKDSGTKSLDGAFRIAMSSDAKFVYVSSGRFRGDQAVSAYTVAQDGQLQVLQEFVSGTGDFVEFQGGNGIALSPDGKSLVALASLSDRLFRFERDVPSGKLTYVGSQQVGALAVPGSAGLCFSPDGRYLYVADEAASAIVVYEMPAR
jgi:6-phosphogluconolactonase (cycloisomerase 2 family)